MYIIVILSLHISLPIDNSLSNYVNEDSVAQLFATYKGPRSCFIG